MQGSPVVAARGEVRYGVGESDRAVEAERACRETVCFDVATGRKQQLRWKNSGGQAVGMLGDMRQLREGQ